jgi:hypothetical protein
MELGMLARKQNARDVLYIALIDHPELCLVRHYREAKDGGKHFDSRSWLDRVQPEDAPIGKRQGMAIALG